MTEQRGSVSLVGAGPGDPELLTLRALRVLERADVVLYDRLVSAEILAMARPEALFVYTGKEEGHAEEIQQEIFILLLRHAWAGRRIVRLKGGDPFVFGRGGEEAHFLKRHGIHVEVIPGVSSALAAPALAGIPVTHRGVAASMAIVTAKCRGGSEADWEKVARIDTLVVLMGVKSRQKVASHLIALGRPGDEPVAFIENASVESQRVVETTLFEIAAGRVRVESPAVMVIGRVVALRGTTVAAFAPQVEANPK